MDFEFDCEEEEKRVYVHFDGPGQHSHTIVFVVNSKTLVQDVCDALLKEFHACFPNVKLAFNNSNVHLEDENDHAWAPHMAADEVLLDRCDVFMKLADPGEEKCDTTGMMGQEIEDAPPPLEDVPATARTAPPAVPITQDHIASITAPALTDKRILRDSPSMLGHTDAQTIVQLITRAQQEQQNMQLRRARDIYDAVLERIHHTDPSAGTVRQICHQQLGVIMAHNKKYVEAIKQFTLAIKLAEKNQSQEKAATPDQKDRSNKDLIKLYWAVAQALFRKDEYSDAYANTEQALACYEALSTKAKNEPTMLHSKRDLVTWKARSMYRMAGRRNSAGFAKGGLVDTQQVAVKMLERVIAEDPQNVEALAQYSVVAVEIGQEGAAVPSLLRALVQCTQNAKTALSPAESPIDPETSRLIPSLLAKIVQLPDGVDKMLANLNDAVCSPAALVFLAQTVKDRGAVHASVDLYEKALKCCTEESTKANLVLSLVHTQEVVYKYREALANIRKLFGERVNETVGSLKVADFYAVIKDIKDPADGHLKQGTFKRTAPYEKPPSIDDAGKIYVKVPGHLPVMSPPETKKGPYSDQELNMLALMFTAVKILYVQGAVQVLPKLCQLIEPVRLGRDLHLTLIRNEHAYYCCIAQAILLLEFPIKVPKNKTDNIYMCGDSHSLSSAWQTIQRRGRPTLINPKLVTGLKCWHLREKCDFYPKRNFESAIQTIPKGATVVFVFGEIDCREGLLVAVEKCKYESVQEGIDVTIKAYLKELSVVVKQNKFKAFIHPVVPVLDLTRPTVKAFNAVLKERVKEYTELTYLDFFKDLLNEEGGFNMKYHMDGTHMSPTYLELLARELPPL